MLIMVTGGLREGCPAAADISGNSGDAHPVGHFRRARQWRVVGGVRYRPSMPLPGKCSTLLKVKVQ